MKHTEWFKHLTGGASGLEASTKAGITTSTLNRQLSKGELSAEFVIALARSYGQNPAEALAATGYLTIEEVSGVTEEALAELLSDRQVIRIAAMRINNDPESWFGTFGELEPEDQTISDLNARRAARLSDTPVGSESDDVSRAEVRNRRYVALEADVEPELGDDDYGPGA